MTDAVKPIVGIVMGSNSDWEVMKNAAEMLKAFDIPFEARVVSAHRMPDEMFDYAETARDRGIRVIIAAAGKAAHLAGAMAANTTLPVVGRSSMLMHRTRVLFPAPLRPMTPKISPRWISILMSFRAATSFSPPPKCLVRPVRRIMGSAMFSLLPYPCNKKRRP